MEGIRGIGRAFLSLLLSVAACDNAVEEKPVSHVIHAAKDAEKTEEKGFRLRWDDRRSRQYDLRLEMRTNAEGAGAMFQSIAGKLKVTPLVKGPSRVILVFRLVNPVVRLGKIVDAPELERLRFELEKPFAGEYLRGVRGETEQFDSGISSVSVGVFRTVSSAFQVADGKGEKWTATELDAAGEYVAEYRIDGKRRLRKRKKEYTRSLISHMVEANYPERVELKVLKCRVELTVLEGILSTVSLRERIRSYLSSEASMDAETDLFIKLDPATSPVTETRPEKEILEGLAIHSTGRPIGSKMHTRLYDLARIGGRTFAELLETSESLMDKKKRERLEEHEKERGAKAAEAEIRTRSVMLRRRENLHEALSAMFRQQPTTIADAKKAVLSGSSGSKLVMEAMADSGTKDSRRALMDLIRSPKLSKKLRIDCATGLVRLAASSPENAELLEVMLRDKLLREHTVPGIGTAARNLREQGDNVHSETLSKALLKGLEAARSPNEKVRYLRGVANSGYPGALDAITKHVRSKDRDVRTAAVDALHFMSAPATNELVARTLKDKEARVRIAALRVAGRRKADEALEKAVSEVALEDESAAARQQAVRIIGSWLEDRPSLRPVLEKIAAEAKDERLRKAAQSHLARGDR